MEDNKNNFLKIGLNLVGFLSLVVLMLGIKIKSDQDRKDQLRINLSESNTKDAETSYSIQDEIAKNRQEIINKIIDSPGKSLTTDYTTTTPIPKVVETPKADKTTKSS